MSSRFQPRPKIKYVECPECEANFPVPASAPTIPRHYRHVSGAEMRANPSLTYASRVVCEGSPR